MRSGQIDGAFNVPLQTASQWQRGNTQLGFAPGMRSRFLSFDLTTEPWNDVHVRRTFAYSIDQVGLVKALLGGHGEAANSMAPPEQWANLLPAGAVRRLYAAIGHFPFDLKKAKAELAQSSVPKGFTTSTIFPDFAPEFGKALLSIGENVAKLGIKLKVKQVPGNQWLSTLYKHKNLGLQIVGYSPDYPDPVNYILLSYPSTAAVPNQFNLANYRNPKVDALLGKQANTASKAVRAKAIAEILKIANEDVPYAPLWWEDAAMVISDKYRYTGFNGLYYLDQWPRNIRAA
jgi:peptide/nickel transport system substrate-binding protein